MSPGRPKSGFRNLSWFAPGCQAQLDSALGPLGFRPGEQDGIGVTFSSDSTVLRVSYYPEDAPRYHLIVAVGAAGRTVALEYLLPDLPRDRRFTSQPELEGVCGRLARYIADSPEARVRLFDERSVAAAVALGLETTARDNLDATEESAATIERAAAARAWASGDWVAAAEHIGRIPSSRVRPSELARKSIALKRAAEQ